MKIIRQDGLPHQIYVYNSADIIDVGNYGKVKLVPRLLPNEYDTIRVVLRHELSDKVFTPLSYFDYTNNYFNLFIEPIGLKDGMKFEIEIFNGSTPIYKGKAMFTNKTVDEIQNFTNTNTNNDVPSVYSKKIKY